MAKHHVLETWSGRQLDLMEPTAEHIYFPDIAWALSRQARFNGHTRGDLPYTVAQHSLWCAWAAQHWFAAPPSVAVHALLHDAHEAYTGDIVHPLKWAVPVDAIQHRLQAAIYAGLLLDPMTPEQRGIVSECDRIALAVEAHHLLPSGGKGWDCSRDLPPDARLQFWEPMPAQTVRGAFFGAWFTLRRGLPLPDSLEDVAEL